MLKFNKWKITDILWQAGIMVLMILNWSQARFASLDQLNWQESNPMLVSITDTPSLYGVLFGGQFGDRVFVTGKMAQRVAGHHSAGFVLLCLWGFL